MDLDKLAPKCNLLLLLVLADFYLTWFGIQFGFYEELNPLMIWLFEIPLPLAALIKLTFTAAMLYLLARLHLNFTTLSKRLFAFTIAAYAAVNLLHFANYYTVYFT